MFVKDAKFYKTFISLTAGMAAQSILSFGVNLADNLMLGRYSETSIAAASLVNQIQYLLQMVSMSGIGMGAVAIISQYWGKGETEPIRRLIALMMKFAAAAGLLFWAVTCFFPKTVLGLMTNQQAVLDESLVYMRVMCFTYLLYPPQSALVMAFRGVRSVRIGPIISAVSLLINVALNWVFIYGNLGAPEMGIKGAAISTLIARGAELLIALAYARFFDKKLKLRLISFFRPDAFYLRDYSKAAFPVIASGASWGFGTIMQTVILAHLSESVIAANSVATVVFQIIGVYALGASGTSGVMMGNAVGSGKKELIRPYARTFQLLFVINGLLTSLVLLLARDFIIGFYMLTPETAQTARAFISVLCVTVVFTAYEFPVESGIILGGGDTRYAFIVDTAFIWLWVLPLSALCAFVFKLPPVVTFIMLKSDQVLKCIPNGIVVNRFRWTRELTREAK